MTHAQLRRLRRRFLIGACCVAAPASLLVASAVQAQSPETAWPAVTRESRPWTRWWWLGSAVDSTNLTRELELLAAAGFGGAEVTSIYGVRGQEANFVPYLSDRWIRLMTHAATEARRLGMGLDIPPGSGWRIGGPDVPMEDASVSLRISADTVQGGTVWRSQLAGRQIEAVVAVSSAGRQVDLSSRAAGASTLRWTVPAGEWTVFVAESRNNGELVKRPAPGGAGNAVDVLSGRAVANYLARFAERTRGVPPGTVRSYFHDSYEYTGDASREFFAAFRRSRGYDLRPHIPALMGRGDPDHVARVKSDYRETMHEMVLAHMAKQLDQWAATQGSLSRNQAHGSPGNLLDLYAASDIPETEIFGPLGNPDSDPLISKFASSAAHVAGKRLTSAESMTWLAEHFTETLDQVKQAVDQLFVSGVNHLLYHGTAYSPASAEWPGWLFYASTQFNPRNPFWRHIPALNQYVARTQAVLQQGVPDADVLLYWPVYDNWHDPTGRRMDFRVHDPKWFHGKPLGEAARMMWDRGYAFDYVSDALLRDRVNVQLGRVVSVGGAEYRAIVVPRTTHMPAETLQRLLSLAEGGATVVFVGGLPEDVPGLANLEARRRALARVRGRVRLGPPSAEGAVASATLGRGRVLVGGNLEALLGAAGVSRERMVDQEGVEFVRRRNGAGHQYFVANHGTGRVEGWLPLSVAAASAVILDPMTGRSGVTRLRPAAGGGIEVLVPLEPGESRIIRTADHAVSGAAWPHIRPAGAPVPLTGTWTVEFVEGGPVLPQPYTTPTLGSWTQQAGSEGERFAGTARYTLRFDDPGLAATYRLDLGRVAESATVRLNGREIGTLFADPFRIDAVQLRPTGNVLEVEVANLAANRIRDLDRREVPWKIFHDINFVGIDYRPFDASGWPVRESGLIGPVTLQPVEAL